jgi:hypothetical protein
MELTSRLLIMAASSSAGPASGYWLATLGAADSEVGVGIRVGSDNALYINATSSGGFMFAVKYDPDGTLNWQRRLTNASTVYSKRLAIDSSDNIYFGYLDNSTALDSWFAAAYNSSGSLLWQKRLNVNSRSGVSIPPSAQCYENNLYVVGDRVSQFNETFAEGNGTGTLIKLIASTGEVVWARNSNNVDNEGKGLHVDASENIFKIMDADRSSLSNRNSLGLLKFNSSGTRIWVSTVSGENYSGDQYRKIFPEALASDSSGNLYVAGYKEDVNGVNRPVLYKFNSSGSFQWAKALGTTTGFYYGVVIDDSDNIYACGNVGSVAVVVSYTSSGAINWQRNFGGGVTDVFRSIELDLNGDLCICGATSSDGQGSNDILILKLPSDGSLTGSYGNFTYALSEYSNNAEVGNSFNSGMNTYSQSVTVTNSSFAEAAGGLVSESTNL